MDGLLVDLRHTLRGVRRRPWSAAAVVITLALAAALNAVVFGILDTALLRPLPFRNGEALVSIGTQWTGLEHANISVPEYLDCAARCTTLTAIGAYTAASFNLSAADGGPEQVLTGRVTASFFDVLGAQPALGRVFTPAEDRPRVSSVVVLSHALWVRRFGGRSDILGRTVRFDEGTREVIGVMPPEFVFPTAEIEMWVPLTINTAVPPPRGRHNHGMIARMAPGRDIAGVRGEMGALARSLEREFPTFYPAGSGWDFSVRSLRNQLSGEFRTPLALLMAAVTFVLLIAAANVANLMLARASVREREFATRRALGAPRSRLVIQALIEGLLLGIAGGAAGTILGSIILDGSRALLPEGLMAPAHLVFDVRTLTFVMTATGMAGGIAAAVTSLRATSPGLQSALRLHGSTDRNTQHIRALLTISQIGLAVMLLIAGGVALRSFVRLISVDSGMTVESIVTARMSALSRYTTREDVSGLFDRSVAALSTTPGVRFAGVVSALPLSGLGADLSLEIEDRPATSANTPLSEQVRTVGGDYFQTMGIPLVTGRLFDSRDASDRPRAAIVSALTASKYWGDRSPLGKRFRLSPGVSSEPWTTVVGVVGDIRNSGLDSAWVPMIYVPASQLPERSMAIVARLEPGLPNATGIIAAAVRRVDPDQPVFAVRTMRDWLSQSVAAPRFSLALLSVFAVLAIVLAAVGVYAVMAFEVARRTRELGIRLALGARPGSLWGLVIGRSLTMAAIGVLLGTVAGGIAVTLFGSMFFGAAGFDVLVFSFVPAGVLGVSLLAASVPARRAMRVEPLVALRTE